MDAKELKTQLSLIKKEKDLKVRDKQLKTLAKQTQKEMAAHEKGLATFTARAEKELNHLEGVLTSILAILPPENEDE